MKLEFPQKKIRKAAVQQLHCGWCKKKGNLKKERSPRQIQEFLDSYKKLAKLRNGISPDISSLEHEVNITEAQHIKFGDKNILTLKKWKMKAEWGVML